MAGILFKPHFFKKDTLTVENGKVSYYKPSFLFWGKTHFTVDMPDVAWCVKGCTSILHRPYIAFGNEAESHKVYLSDIKHADELHSHMLEAGARYAKACEAVNVEKLPHFNSNNEVWHAKKNTLWMYPEKMLVVGPKGILMGTVTPSDTVFFNVSSQRAWTSLWLKSKNTLYFGGENEQAYFACEGDKELQQKVYKHILDNGSPLSAEVKSSYADTFWLSKLLKPMKFRVHESISLTDDAVIYNYRKGRKSDNIYLPFADMSFALLKKGLFHSNKILIIGKQNIVSELEFSNEAIAEIKEQLMAKRVSDCGECIKPRTMFGIMKNSLSKHSLFLSEDNIVYVQRGKMAKSANHEWVEEMCWKKKHWYYFVGYLWYLYTPVNMRDDQGAAAQQVMMPRISIFKKNRIKELVKPANYNSSSYKKTCIIPGNSEAAGSIISGIADI